MARGSGRRISRRSERKLGSGVVVVVGAAAIDSGV